MTTATDIANWALQVPGTRTNVTDAELAANSTNEGPADQPPKSTMSVGGFSVWRRGTVGLRRRT